MNKWLLAECPHVALLSCLKYDIHVILHLIIVMSRHFVIISCIWFIIHATSHYCHVIILFSYFVFYLPSHVTYDYCHVILLSCLISNLPCHAILSSCFANNLPNYMWLLLYHVISSNSLASMIIIMSCHSHMSWLNCVFLNIYILTSTHKQSHAIVHEKTTSFYQKHCQISIFVTFEDLKT